jgi:hypothetical protein
MASSKGEQEHSKSVVERIIADLHQEVALEINELQKYLNNLDLDGAEILQLFSKIWYKVLL